VTGQRAPQPGDEIEWWDDQASVWRPGVLRGIITRFRVTGPDDPTVGSSGWQAWADEVRWSVRPQPRPVTVMGQVET
jgi:hypothetical protein